MPLAYRTILPEWLGRRTLSDEEGTEDNALVAVSHNIILGAIVQLASLVRHADDIFCDLAEECQRIFEKTESITTKVVNVQRIIAQLDSTEVTIPVGTLKQFSARADHHVAKHGFECDHFTPGNRPYCIRFNYSMCELTPARALQGVDPLRKDGRISSHLFKLWPIALNDLNVPTDDMAIPKRYFSSLAQTKRYKALKLKERRRTIHSIDNIYHKESSHLQASKTDHLSKSQPSIMVAVNTSGSGFERMTLFRQSLSGEESWRRSKRRRTVSGVSSSLMQEIEQFEQDRRILRDGPRTYSLDDLDQKEVDAQDEVMQQYLLEMDSAIAEREEEQYAEQREKKLLKFIPCRRTRSLPRCVKLLTSRGREELTLSSMFPKKLQRKSTGETKPRQIAVQQSIEDKFPSTGSLSSFIGEDTKSVRSSKRSSLIGDKIRSLVAGTLKPRPKSLDFDSIEVIEEVDKKARKMKMEGRSSSLSRVSSPSMPDGTLSRTPSTESQVGPGSYYYFDSNTLPRAQAKKYDFPWDSLPKDWTTSVRLREISKRRKEDRQSSSGNWSQSGYSSNRQSMDSDAKSSVPSSVSQNSIGKDSGRDSPRSSGDRDGLDTGYMGDAASTESISDTKSVSNTDSEDWIRSLAEQAANRGDVTSTSAEALSNLSRLTKQNIRNLDVLIPSRPNLRPRRFELEDDGESSVYSIDQEGFYTSFHTDSGLKRSTNTLLEDEDDDLMMPRSSRSAHNVTSCVSLKSVIFKPVEKDTSGSSSSDSFPNIAESLNDNVFHENDASNTVFLQDFEGGVEYGETGTLKAKKKTVKKRKVPPLPPPRTTSINGNNAADAVNDGRNDSPNSVETSSESSDHETIYARLKMKTGISANAFPSWCVGTTSDDDERLNAESSEVEELFSGKDNWLSGTMPRASLNIRPSNDFDQTTNSWPRVKRLNPQQSGILKNNERVKTKNSPSNLKVLNFDPVVNLFDARSPHGVQMPLSRLSSSDESSSPGTSTFDAHPLSHKCAQPLSLTERAGSSSEQPMGDEETHKEMPLKNKPPLPTRHESTRPRSMVMFPREALALSSTPAPSHSSASLYSGQDQFNCSNLSTVHSSSSTNIDLMDSFDNSLATHDKSETALTSNSTIALSDIDSSSLTCVTMSDSSSSGSSLSLNWDTDDTPNPTPMATPIRKHAPVSLSCDSSNTKTLRKSSVSKGATQPPAQQLNVPSILDYNSTSTLLSTSSAQNKDHTDISQHLSYSPPSSGSVQYDPTSHLLHPPSGSRTNPAHQPAEPSITRKTCSSNSGLEQLNNISSIPTANASGSDRNNNRNKFTSTATFGSSMLKPESQSASGQTKPLLDDSLLHLSQSHNATNTSSSFGGHRQNPHPQMPNVVYRSSQNERRRSSPNVAPSMNPPTFSGDSSGYMGTSDTNHVKRRQSDNRLYSPADSGYGSPPVPSQSITTTKTFSYSPPQTPFSAASSQANSSSVSSISSGPLLIQGPQLRNTRSDFVAKPSADNTTSAAKPDCPIKLLRQASNQSIESINSQFSVSSTQQLISKVQKTDLSQAELHRENSTESVHSNGSGSRSDSYRVAMLIDNDEASLIPNKMPNLTKYQNNNSRISVTENNPRIHRQQFSKSLSVPAPAAYTDDVVSRADSYRNAVRQTQSMLLGDLYGRNTSYRLATCEEDVVITDNRMDSCNLWTGKTGSSRDSRRMGITDIDQLKQYSNEPDGTEKSGNKYNVANTPHAKKKLSTKPDSEKPSQTEQKKFMKLSSKDKSKQKTQSSTYIRFDPIFESGEDLRASIESLRPPSITSVRTLAKADSNETLTSENVNLIKQRVGSMSPARKRSSSQGRREDKPALSIFGSIKTTIKSIGGSKGD